MRATNIDMPHAATSIDMQPAATNIDMLAARDAIPRSPR